MTPAAPLTITAKPKLSPRKDTLVISAHGATIDVTSRTVTINYSPLLAALQSTHGAAEGGASISIGENGGKRQWWAKGCVEYHGKKWW